MTGQGPGVTVGRVAGLRRYPVKSMGGEDLDRADVTASGLVGDRAYALVDAETGKVASAKHPGKWGALLGWQAAFVAPPAEGSPVPPVRIVTADGAEIRSDDPDADTLLSKAIGRPVRLAATAPAGVTFETWWPDAAGVPSEHLEGATGRDGEGTFKDEQVAPLAPPGTFFDLTVLHLVTTATLARLASLYGEGRFDVRRFRPNVVLDVEGDGFVENEWAGRSVRPAGGGAWVVLAPMPRCVMTTLPQGDLPADKGILQTIARHNRVEIPGFGTWSCVGVAADVVTPGPVAVGDDVGLDAPAA